MMVYSLPGGMRRRSMALLAAALLLPIAAEGKNGDIQRLSDVLAGVPLAGVTQDLRDGSFWIVGSNGSSDDFHRIYHLSPDLTSVTGSIENPHPGGVIPAITSNLGIAFRTLSQSRTLFVLSLLRTGEPQGFVVRETDPAVAGNGFTGTAFAVTPPDADANLSGLAYDILTREFWTRDIQNEKLLRFDVAGNVTREIAMSYRDLPPGVIRGTGVAHEVDVVDGTAVSYLYTAIGDIFTVDPAQVVRWKIDSGAPTGLEVPLVPEILGDLTAYHVTRFGAQRRIIGVTAGGLVAQVEMVVSDPAPPGELGCSLTVDNHVTLAWKNHGSGVDGTYGGAIQVLRNGVPFTTVPGSATSFTDTTPIEGLSSYSLRASDTDGTLSAPAAECEVTAGTGGLVRFARSPGATVFDVARDAATGTIYASDSFLAKIFVFDAELQPIREIDAPWSDPGAIAFVPAIGLGLPPTEFTNLLAVARINGSQLRFIDLDGNEKTTISLAVNGSSTAQIGGLTFLPETRQFALLETSSATGTIFILDSNGGLVQTCEPSFLLGLDFDRGIAFDPLRDTFLTAFSGGVVRELFNGPGCPANTIESFPPIELHSLGKSFDIPGFIGGIEIAENTLLVGSPETAALYEILIFPFEGSFVRGDVDQDGNVDVTDAVAIAEYLFRSGPAPACLDAADVNDDGVLDVADPVYHLFFLFLGTAAPPPPFPDAGADPTFRDNLGCVGSSR